MTGDIVDDFYAPFVRPLGNLVIAFALAEAELLDLVSEMLGGDELKAVALLKSQNAKEQVLSLVRSIGLSGLPSNATAESLRLGPSPDVLPIVSYAPLVSEASRRFAIPEHWIRTVMEKVAKHSQALRQELGGDTSR